HTGTHADVDLELTPPARADQIQKMLYARVFIVRHGLAHLMQYSVLKRSPYWVPGYPIAVPGYNDPPAHLVYPDRDAGPRRSAPPVSSHRREKDPDPARCPNRS